MNGTPYRRRTSERSVLFRLLQEHLASWQALRNEDPGCQVSAGVERELRTCLECGIRGHCFARAFCKACGHDFLIAFSCKGRGICPSCTAKRMSYLGRGAPCDRVTARTLAFACAVQVPSPAERHAVLSSNSSRS